MYPWSPSSYGSRLSELLAPVAKGLAHPARVAIVEQLADGQPRTAGDIVDASGLAQSTVSEHLRILRDAGILSSRKAGNRVWYQIELSALREFIRALDDLID